MNESSSESNTEIQNYSIWQTLAYGIEWTHDDFILLGWTSLIPIIFGAPLYFLVLLVCSIYIRYYILCTAADTRVQEPFFDFAHSRSLKA